MKPWHWVWGLLAVWGCASDPAATRRSGAVEESRTGGVAFIEDDYVAALRQAREKRRPLVVETWAPWCHACRAMRATVLTDPAVTVQAGRFTWLAINTDAATNAGFLDRFPVDTWPTVLVIDPAGETVVARSLGAVSAPQLLGFLDQAEQAFRQGPDAPEAHVARADAFAARGAYAEAVGAYQHALSRLSPESPRRAGTVVSLLKSFLATEQPGECLRLTVDELPRLTRAEDRARVLYVGIGCSLDVEGPEVDAPRRRLEEAASRTLAAPADALVPDVRSSLYEALVELRQALGDEAGATSLAKAWLAFIESSAERARGTEARAAFDSHRVMAALRLEQPERAIPALERTQRELPGDYNAPARLAELYLQAGRLDAALSASERALSLAEDGGRALVIAGHARVLLARGERAQAERRLTEALQALEGQPEGFGTRRQRLVLQATLRRVQASGKNPEP